jgi:tetratricopeptide (TPR) repeat protein
MDTMDNRAATARTLRALLAEACCSGAELARSVNRIGAESGMSLRYGRASVAQWLSGTRPRPPVPGLVAEALTRRLGRVITPDDLGYDADQPWDIDPVLDLCTLAGETDHRVYQMSALSVPAQRTSSEIATTGSSAIRIGAGEVTAATTMLQLFAATEAAIGAADTRPVTANYLSTTISAWLRAPAPDQVHRDLLSVAARLAYLCGFQCVDDEKDGAAQRYYRAALQLSAEAGDMIARAVVLRGMSYQAHTLGHHTQALALAEAAHTAGTGAPPSTRAFLLGQLALACAATADRHRAVTHLRTAEYDLLRATDDTAAVGVHHEASLAHQLAATRANLGDRAGAITALHRSLRHRPATERRSRALTLARLAELQLQQGELEEAVVTWHRFLDDYPGVNSARAHTALANLRGRVRPHIKNHAANELLYRATTLLHLP